MSASLALPNVLERLRVWASASRFLTFSVLLHLLLILLVGGTVLYQFVEKAPDFESGVEGLLSESASQAPPGDVEEGAPLEQFRDQTVPPPAPLDAVVSETQTRTWTLAAVSNVQIRGVSNSLKGVGMSSLGDSLKKGSGMGAGGRGLPGGARWAMIFGKKVVARKLGVILDVSGSAHQHLAGAVTEIQKGFADATMILYPGCGMVDFTGTSGHEIRRFSSITKRDLEKSQNGFTTPAQLGSALEIGQFDEMTKRPSVKNTLFVSWYDNTDDDHEKLTDRTQVAFDDLIKRNVDTIYWFADFEDHVDAKVVKTLSDQLAKRKITLHVHNFAGKKINRAVTEMAERTGGTVNTEKPQ